MKLFDPNRTVVGGVLFDLEGRPIGGAKVTVEGRRKAFAVTTDADGLFAVRTMEEGGKFRVTIEYEVRTPKQDEEDSLTLPWMPTTPN
jgi:hypothetical protein